MILQMLALFQSHVLALQFMAFCNGSAFLLLWSFQGDNESPPMVSNTRFETWIAHHKSISRPRHTERVRLVIVHPIFQIALHIAGWQAAVPSTRVH